MRIKNFFKNAFSDMKESAKAQHEVDKAEFAAAKAESKANFNEAKALGNSKARKAMMQAERQSKIDAANARKAAAQARIDSTKQ